MELLVTEYGSAVANYSYDAWGLFNEAFPERTDNSDIAVKLNPYRYRSYMYDADTGFYYLRSRFYDPETGRFISPDSIDYINPTDFQGLNLYAYCANDPVNFCDPFGLFPILACILGISALIGLGLTIGGVASDNHVLTAVGLTVVAVPALISGGLAVAVGIGGATLTGIVGGVTVAAGLGTSTFATAEYQEAITGHNWMLDAGMSEGWYNGLMFTTATIATLGTFASSIGYSFQIKSITNFGTIEGTQYKGIKFEQISPSGSTRLRSLEWHNHLHNGHYHWQLNKWDGIIRKGAAGRWLWWLGKF